MADTKISALVDGQRGLFDDELVSARSGANRKHDLEDLIGYATIGHPRRRFSYYDDFIGETGTASYPLLERNSTGSTSAQATDSSNRVGLLRSSTGGSATGRTDVSSALSAIRLGGGAATFECDVNVTQLSTSAQRFQLVIGFHDTATAANQVDAVAFMYDEGGVSTGSAASPNWQTLTSSNSTRTWATSSTAVSAGAWVNLRIEVNAAASSVSYFINGTQTATNHTTNIPSGAGRELGFGWLLIKSVGTTAVTVDFDWIAVEVDFTSARI